MWRLVTCIKPVPGPQTLSRPGVTTIWRSQLDFVKTMRAGHLIEVWRLHFWAGTCGFSPKTPQVGRSNQPNRNVVFSPQTQPASPLHVAMRAKPNVFFPSVFEGGGVRQSREGERNNGGRKKKKQVTSTAPGNDSADMTETTEGVFGRRIISLREKKRRQELIMSLIHLKCWLILITLLQRDYERLTDTKLELNC